MRHKFDGSSYISAHDARGSVYGGRLSRTAIKTLHKLVKGEALGKRELKELKGLQSIMWGLLFHTDAKINRDMMASVGTLKSNKDSIPPQVLRTKRAQRRKTNPPGPWDW